MLFMMSYVWTKSILFNFYRLASVGLSFLLPLPLKFEEKFVLLSGSKRAILPITVVMPELWSAN